MEETFFNQVQQKTPSFFTENTMSISENYQPTQHPNNQPTNQSNIYLMKAQPPPDQLSGSMNLLVHHGLESTYNRFCIKKVKESLSSYLSIVPNSMDEPSTDIKSTLQHLIKDPPITTKSIQQIEPGSLMAAFRLHPGPLPEKYLPELQKAENKKRHKHKSSNKLDSIFPDVKSLELGNKKGLKRGTEDKKKKKKVKKRKKEKERGGF